MTMAADAVSATPPPCAPPHPGEGVSGDPPPRVGQDGEGVATASRAAANAPRYRIPVHYPGQRVGLFGGTFDPPHEAHLAACLLAMKRLALDQVWWLVTPGNPLKNTTGLAPLDERVAAASRLARHPRMAVTGIEAEIGVRYSYDIIRYLVSHCPGVRFVWIMGADNLRSFHRWQKWRGIAELVLIAVIDRLGPSLRATGSVAAQALGRRRVPESQAASLLGRPPPAWVLLHGLKSPLSSTALRAVRRSQKLRIPQPK
jgi:nicotinate-nucleotide adenylyltransferase